MNVCQYDNPDTMCRELWQDGEMIAHLSCQLLAMKPAFKGAKYLHFGFDASNWKTGRILGDREALSQPQEKSDETNTNTTLTTVKRL